MNSLFRSFVLFFSIFFVFGMSGCSFLEENGDPFSRQEIKKETLEGELFPFSASIQTNATHRLEKDGRLIAYLSSRFVPLQNFERKFVDVEGFFETEDLRDIFWVEKISVHDDINTTTLEKKSGPQRFASDSFTFLYPETWEFSISSNQAMHFVDKMDSARKVFLIFSVEEKNNATSSLEKNIQIGSLKGNRTTNTDAMNRERTEIRLFSEKFNHVYKFIFTSAFEEFEKKNAFFSFLNSFVDGTDEVKSILEAEKIKQAEEEMQKLEEQAKELQIKEDEEKKLELEKTEKKNIAPEISSVKETLSPQTVPSTIVSDGSFTNLISEKSLNYSNPQQNFFVRFPWGMWFRSFSANEESTIRIGAAKQDFVSADQAQIWVELLKTKGSGESLTETMDNNRLIVVLTKADGSMIRVSGASQLRNEILSIAHSAK